MDYPAAEIRAAVVITTRNRKEELRGAIGSALTQTAAPEILVIDDGSTDGTSDLVRSEFPSVRLHSFPESAGYIERRNQAAELATGAIIFSIDDDAAFASPHVIEQTLREFDDPRVAAVAIPFINVRQDDVVRQESPDERIHAFATYIGTAHAVRRDVFLALGGYRAWFIHMWEEGDYCLRLLNAGYIVRLGRSDPIHHFESPRRDFRRMDFYGSRNTILYAWHNVPMPYLPIVIWVGSLKRIALAIRLRRPWQIMRGVLWGYCACIKYWRQREPVTGAVFRLSRRLKTRAIPLSEIEAELSSIRHMLSDAS